MKLMVTPFKKDLDDITKRLQRHAKDADNVAVATELFRAAKFREGIFETTIFIFLTNQHSRTGF